MEELLAGAGSPTAQVSGILPRLLLAEDHPLASPSLSVAHQRVLEMERNTAVGVAPLVVVGHLTLLQLKVNGQVGR